MSVDVDILNLDLEIQKEFQLKQEKLSELKEKLQKLAILKQKNEEEIANIEMSSSPTFVHSHVLESLNSNYNKLQKTIKDLENNEEYKFYIAQTSEILHEYKRLLSIPIKLNFMGKEVKSDKEKQKLIDAFISIAKNYIKIDLPVKEESPTKNKRNTEKIVCDYCSNKKEFEIIDGDTYVCSICFSEQIVLKHASSYKDADRININTKYTYDRRIHFREAIMQLMGRQNATVDKSVYDDLEREFDNHYLLIGDKNTDKHIRFKKITKEHVTMFLKDLGHTKHYENVNLIHYTMTGKKPDDISHLEDKLMQDFDVIINLYDKLYKNIERKNFINTAFLLYNLLIRHKHPCKKEDFSILKTIDRKNFHDEVTKNLFEHAGWTFTPT